MSNVIVALAYLAGAFGLGWAARGFFVRSAVRSLLLAEARAAHADADGAATREDGIRAIAYADGIHFAVRAVESRASLATEGAKE